MSDRLLGAFVEKRPRGLSLEIKNALKHEKSPSRNRTFYRVCYDKKGRFRKVETALKKRLLAGLFDMAEGGDGSGKTDEEEQKVHGDSFARLKVLLAKRDCYIIALYNFFQASKALFFTKTLTYEYRTFYHVAYCLFYGRRRHWS